MSTKKLLQPLVVILAILWANFDAMVFQAKAQPSNTFTLQIGGTPLPPSPLLLHGELWRYRKGTNYPGTGWQTNADAALDGTWLSGPGGIGYSTDTPIETNQCRTILTDMVNGYTTLYMRRTFDVTNAIDPAAHLFFTNDWDDAFAAYLDGVEIARAGTRQAVGTEPPYNTTSITNHESSRGTSVPVNPPLAFDLGAVGTRLAPGPHILALIGINGTAGSSDWIQIPDLAVGGASSGVVNGSLFSIVSTNTVTLFGTNTVNNSARVVVNGDDAIWNPAQGTWTKAQALQPGWNRLFIAVLDGSGNILNSTNLNIVSELATVTAGGLLTNNTSWAAAQGIVRVTNTLTVANGATLSIGEGVVVLLSPGAGIEVAATGVLDVIASEAHPACFLPADGTTPWQSLRANGTGALLNLRHADVAAGQVVASTNSLVTIEDTVVRDYHVTGRNMLQGQNGAQLTLRRVHLLRYEQCRFAETPMLIEDSLFEEIGSDTTDFADQGDIVVRRTTYRRGHGSNTDALDLGGNTKFLAESCLIHDFPDKGASIAANSDGAVIRNCLIYNVGIGIATYASSNVLYEGNTIANSTAGLSLYLRAGFTGAGHAFGTNNIVWGNATNVNLAGGSTLDMSYSDIGDGAVYPGAGNINIDPLFANAPQADFSLLPGSPALGTGLGGANMGVTLPVGGIPGAPLQLAALVSGTNALQLIWQDDSENEQGFAVERSTNGTAWQPLASTPANATSWTDSTASLGQLFYYRVRATNNSGVSAWSNPASAKRQIPTTLVGGILASNTVWSPAMGHIVLLTNLTVPTNITLTMLPGTQVKITNGIILRAIAGGSIQINGTAEEPVRVEGVGATNVWRALSAAGPGASLTIHHAEISGMQTTVYSNAVGLIEDSSFHHFNISGTTLTQPIILMHFAAPSIVRRCHLHDYYESLWRNGVFLIEYCLFEDMIGDALDFDAAQPGTVLRQSTFRKGNRVNVDAVDVGPAELGGSQDVIIEECLMFNFPYDKGVSIGEGSHGTVVRNCLMYLVSRGVQVKDTCTANIYNNTIVEAEIGLHGYFKSASYPGGGHITNSANNIVWHTTNAIVLEPDSIFVAHHSDLGGTNWPGMGNIDADPLFLDPANRDYRLATNSPCRGTGENGVTMGPTYPVGGVPDVPAGLYARYLTGDTIMLGWGFNAIPSGYIIERATNGGSFAFLKTAGAAETNVFDSGLAIGSIWHYRVRGTNFLGESFNSDVATVFVSGDTDGDGLPDDYELAFGLSPYDPQDAHYDRDGDGLTSLEEFLAGTNPTNKASVLRLEVTLPTPTNLVLGFNAVSNRTYSLLGRTNLATDPWHKLQDIPAVTDDRWVGITNSPAEPNRFFRVVTPQQP